jgi:hypothetical protein
VLRCKTLGNIFSTPFDFCQFPPPGGAIPDLEVVIDACHDDVAAKLGVLEEGPRNHHAALFVEVGLGGAGEEEALDLARPLAERIQRGESRLDKSSPIRTTVGEQAPVQASRDNDPLREDFTEFGWESEAILVINGVLVFA